MPHNPTDQTHPHLPLPRVEQNQPRRKRRGFSGQPPNRGPRPVFAKQMLEQADFAAQQAKQVPPTPGYPPHLILRIPIADKAPVQQVADMLAEAGLTTVSIEPDNAVVVFRNEVDLADFRSAMRTYARGPARKPDGTVAKSTKWDILQFVEPSQLRNWTRVDRIGSRLALEIGQTGDQIEPGRLYTLDVELWHPGLQQEARQALNEVKTLIPESPATGERVADTFMGSQVLLARVLVLGAKLDQLLNASIIASVDLPPRPVFDRIAARRATPRDFPTPPSPPQDGPRVCILDSGIASNHPLLAANVAAAEAILTATDDPADGHGHGTHVGGLAVFGNVRACYENGAFSSPVQLFSARVLNAQNRFDDNELIITQLRKAIDFFFKAPHNCRVFNLSLASDQPAINEQTQRQTQWAAALDTLCRERKVLIVISTGNNPVAQAWNAEEAEAILANYPAHLLAPECAVADPATAAIPLTVGSIAEYEAVAIRRGTTAQDQAIPIAKQNQPSPFTRTGPGLSGAMKPEFVHYGGNLLFEGVGQTRRIKTQSPDSGTAVMSFSHQPLSELFAWQVGTSQAAPRISRMAAILWEKLERSFTGPVDPNLIRAVLASSAEVPEESASLGDEKDVRRLVGYGLPDLATSLESSDRRVTMLTQGSLQLDSFAVFEVPVPDAFLKAPGKKRIILSLAFDPPVRIRRANYFGTEMEMRLIRGKSLESVIASYKAVAANERKSAPKSISGASNCTLKPGLEELQTSTLQRREFRFERTPSKDYGDTYYLIIHAKRAWAPESITTQDYGLAVTLTAEEPQLYRLVRQRVQSRQRARQR